MTARKTRPDFGADVTADMSIRDVSAALGVSKTEIGRWLSLAELGHDEFERRLAVMRATGKPLSTSAILKMNAPVPARGRVERVLGIIKNMTAAERDALLACLGAQHASH